MAKSTSFSLVDMALWMCVAIIPAEMNAPLERDFQFEGGVVAIGLNSLL